MKNIAYECVLIDLTPERSSIEVGWPFGDPANATVEPLPFIDPKKDIPARKAASTGLECLNTADTNRE